MKKIDINTMIEISGGDVCGWIGAGATGIIGFLTKSAWVGLGAGFGAAAFCEWVA